MSTIERAVEIAAKAHAGQKDKAGETYLFHPLRVMLSVSTPAERMAAVLHDVIEDTPVTLDDLRAEGFPVEVIEAIHALSKSNGETRLAAARRAAQHSIARVPNHADGAYAVLLALECLGRFGRNSLQTTPVLSFKATNAGESELEADFAFLWQESVFGERRDGIVFGESKTYGPFAHRDFDRMRQLARRFPGAILVFSTLRESLTPGEKRQVIRIARAGRKRWKPERPLNPVLVLTGTEILSWHHPPYCWPEPQKTRFQRLHGLLAFCDATQQIHLGLPSWQEDWQRDWDKKRARVPAALPQVSRDDQKQQ